MALEGPLGTLLVVAIWSVCPCVTAESLAYLLHRLVHRACILREALFGKLTAKRRRFGFEEE